jgi:hypothetical protein
MRDLTSNNIRTGLRCIKNVLGVAIYCIYFRGQSYPLNVHSENNMTQLLAESIYRRNTATPQNIAKKGFRIISCTFRNGEQHIKSLTEMEHGKIKNKRNPNISQDSTWFCTVNMHFNR